jgi:uncharacterized protein YjbJ (UPF0337 family)
MDNAHHEDKVAASVADDTTAAVGAFADDARSQVERLACQTSAAAGHAYGQARDQVRGAASALADSVERRPGIALLAVGLVCGALGFLLARR